MVFIGSALFVEGARPDVETAYPGYPCNYKAGWGYMMLTNFLPNQGNDTFTFYAIARDVSGQEVTLGSKTVTCNNTAAVKPFGAIDTPTQGGRVSGSSYINYGWVLTPQPNMIPTNGSALHVYVDGVNLGSPVYNLYREDIAGLFPGYANSNGAVGSFSLDTTTYENGVHTIQWTAVDNAGNSDGIGSRYFTILNTGGSKTQGQFKAQRSRFVTQVDSSRIPRIPMDYSSRPVRVKKGYNNTGPQTVYPDKNRTVYIEIEELERLEIRFFDCENSTLNNITPLPIGSTLDVERGIFYWSPGPGFVGDYRLVFIETDRHGNEGNVTGRNVIIKIKPKFPGK